jgi:hypothetical protein
VQAAHFGRANGNNNDDKNTRNNKQNAGTGPIHIPPAGPRQQHRQPGIRHAQRGQQRAQLVARQRIHALDDLVHQELAEGAALG